MKRNINNIINNFNLQKHISYQIVFSLFILKNLANKEKYSNVGIQYFSDFKSLWNNLINFDNPEERKQYFIYAYLPALQNHNISENFNLLFRNFHIPFIDIDNTNFSNYIDIVDSSTIEETIEFISDVQNDFRWQTIKTLDNKIQENIIRLLDIKKEDKVLDLNVESSNFLSLLTNNSNRNTGFLQSHQSLLIRFLELLLNNNENTNLIFNNPLSQYSDKLDNNFDAIFTIPVFGLRLSRQDYDLDFPIQASISHNLYIQKALNSLKYDGRCLIIVPYGFLNQSSKETENIRKFILDKLVCIVNLGTIFKPSVGIKVSLLLLKNDNHNNQILMSNYQDYKIFPLDKFTLFTEIFVNSKYNLEQFNLNDIEDTLLVNKQDIIDNNFILDFNRYKPLEDFNIKIKHPSELIKDIEMDAKSLLESITNISYKLNNLKIEKTNLQTLKLEDISLSKEIKLGKPLPKDNIESGEIPYVNISDITRCTTDYLDSSEVMISDDFAYRHNLTVVEPNSVLLSVRGTIGKVILTKSKIAISTTLIAIEVDTNKANAYFIYQWLLSKKEYLDANATGMTIPSLSISFLRELKIELPPKEIQDRFEMYQNDLNNIKNDLNLLTQKNQNLSKSIFNQFY